MTSGMPPFDIHRLYKEHLEDRRSRRDHYECLECANEEHRQATFWWPTLVGIFLFGVIVGVVLTR